jgi:hypothetical protein
MSDRPLIRQLVALCLLVVRAEQMVALIRAGLATAASERVVVAGSRKMEVARVKITEAGRKTLERMRP